LFHFRLALRDVENQATSNTFLPCLLQKFNKDGSLDNKPGLQVFFYVYVLLPFQALRDMLVLNILNDFTHPLVAGRQTIEVLSFSANVDTNHGSLL
jgi:hypothetical protein